MIFVLTLDTFKVEDKEEENEEEQEEEDLLYVPGYLNRLIDPLLKSRVPLSISETARHQSGMCYQTGKSIKRDGKTEGKRGDRGTGSKLSADWFFKWVSEASPPSLQTCRSQAYSARRWNIQTRLRNLAACQMAQSHHSRLKSANISCDK